MTELKSDRVTNLFDAIATRLSQEPDLDHFLGWFGGTLEYWIEVVTAATGKRFGWTAHSETPYITACPNHTRKSNVKWADGVVIADDGWAVLLEIKTVPMKEEALGKAIQQVPRDFAALLAIDWPATLDHPAKSNYTDPQWWSRRKDIRDLWALNLLLVHAASPFVDVDKHLERGLLRGISSLRKRFPPPSPTWMDLLQPTMSAPHYKHELRGRHSAGLLLGWAKLLPLVRQAAQYEPH